MNLEQLRKDVYATARRLGKRVPTVFVADYQINKAGDEILRDTTIARIVRTFNAVANELEYLITGQVLEAYLAKYNNIPLDRTSPYDLDEEYGSSWEMAKGTPAKWYMSSIDTFRPWPTPSIALADGFKLTISVGWEQDLTQPQDDPAVINGFPAKYHRALVYKAAMDLWVDEKSAVEYFKLEKQMKSDLSQQFSQSSGFVPYRYL